MNTIAEIQSYYDKRKAYLDSKGIQIPNDLERIGILLNALKKHD